MKDFFGPIRDKSLQEVYANSAYSKNDKKRNDYKKELFFKCFHVLCCGLEWLRDSKKVPLSATVSADASELCLPDIHEQLGESVIKQLICEVSFDTRAVQGNKSTLNIHVCVCL